MTHGLVMDIPPVGLFRGMDEGQPIPYPSDDSYLKLVDAVHDEVNGGQSHKTNINNMNI